jgi:hypothetical protein
MDQLLTKLLTKLSTALGSAPNQFRSCNCKIQQNLLDRKRLRNHLERVPEIAEDGGMRKDASDSLLSAASPRSFAVVRVE